MQPEDLIFEGGVAFSKIFSCLNIQSLFGRFKLQMQRCGGCSEHAVLHLAIDPRWWHNNPKLLQCVETQSQHHHLCSPFPPCLRPSSSLHPSMSPGGSTGPCWKPVSQVPAVPGRVSLETSLTCMGGVSSHLQPSCQVLPWTKRHSLTDSRDKENYHQEMKFLKLQMHVQKNH